MNDKENNVFSRQKRDINPPNANEDQSQMDTTGPPNNLLDRLYRQDHPLALTFKCHLLLPMILNTDIPIHIWLPTGDLILRMVEVGAPITIGGE